MFEEILKKFLRKSEKIFKKIWEIFLPGIVFYRIENVEFCAEFSSVPQSLTSLFHSKEKPW